MPRRKHPQLAEIVVENKAQGNGVANLTGSGLSNESIARLFWCTIRAQTKTPNVRMGCRPVLARIAFHLADLDHCEGIAASLASHEKVRRLG